MTEDAKMHNDSTGGIRRRARINPPVAYFSEWFSPISPPPPVLSEHDLLAKAHNMGFKDALTGQAAHFFSKVGYEYAKGYFALFFDSGKPIENMSLMNVNKIILFDKAFKSLLMEYIGLFELQFRAQYSSALARGRGAFAHRNPKNFKDRTRFEQFLRKYEAEFNRQMKNRNRTVINGYEKYGDVPAWTAVEIMSFGTLSMLYGNTKSRAIRDEVARSFNASMEEFASWTRALSSVRNVCAHFGQLCGKRLVSRPKKIPGIPGDNGNPFYIVAILLKLLRENALFIQDVSLSYELLMLRDVLQLLNDNYEVLATCRIPADWQSIILNDTVVGMSVEEHPQFFGFGHEGTIYLDVQDGETGVIKRLTQRLY